jgi:hypothetical protein
MNAPGTELEAPGASRTVRGVRHAVTARPYLARATRLDDDETEAHEPGKSLVVPWEVRRAEASAAGARLQGLGPLASVQLEVFGLISRNGASDCP